MTIDTKRLAARLTVIESVAWIPRVTSTNDIGRRVVIECVDNEIDLPSAAVIANEQSGGRGRASRTWYSPPGCGIYCTILHSRPESRLLLFPLEIAVIVAGFLEEVYDIPARLKWPNDVLVHGDKIAGILIEGRSFNQTAYLAVGIGINVEPLPSGAPQGSTSIAAASRSDSVGLTSATEAFVEFIDGSLAAPRSHETVLEEWTRRSVHARGDAIECLIGGEIIRGSWHGIDPMGRAVLTRGAEKVTISAGDLIFAAGRKSS